MAEFVPRQRQNQANRLVRSLDRTAAQPAQAEHSHLAQESPRNQAMQRLLKTRAIQARLTVNEPGDRYEQEADRIADQAMRMPEPRLQRQIEPEEEEEEEPIQTKPLAEQIMPLVQRQVEPEEEEEEPVLAKLVEGAQVQRQEEEPEEEEEELIQTKPATGQSHRVNADLEAQIRALQGGGQPLPLSERSFFEPRFGYDFSQVRVHTGEQAAETTCGINARAFTLGRDIVLGAGQYAPETAQGRRLLAHELAHVVQQGRAGTASSAARDRGRGSQPGERSRARPAGRRRMASQGPDLFVQRDPDRPVPTQYRDPNFLTCLILCYIGIPPAIWRQAVELYLRAVWEEYRQRYGEARGGAQYQTFRRAFMLYSPFRVFNHVLAFTVRSKIGPLTIRATAARALREQIARFLLRRGGTAAGLVVAEQIARKIVLAVEIAVAAGCTVYCGSMAYARVLVQLTDAIARGIADAFNVLQTLAGVGRALVAGIFVRPLLVARATMDPTNWDLSPLPPRTRANLSAVGLYLWATVGRNDANRFARNIQRRLNTYRIPARLMRDIASAIQDTLRRRTGFQFVITPQLLRGLTPLTFVQFLRDYRLLRFRRDPERIADAQLSASGSP